MDGIIFFTEWAAFSSKLDKFSKGMRKNGIFKNWRFHM